MKSVAFLLLVFLTDGVSCDVCTYQDVLDYLNLTTGNNVFKLTRPVLDHRHATVVKLNIILFAILGVVEKTQTFVPFVWSSTRWNNERISWNPDKFCGISHVSVPKSLLWKPDLLIYEMIQKDDSPQVQSMIISYDGTVSMDENLRVFSTCHMDVHKFPFDTQECNISISSANHCIDEMRIIPISNSTRATQFSHQVIKTQGEWEFLHLTVSTQNFSFEERKWEMLTYAFTIKRRPLLHVINFLLPVLFFLALDLASFFIADYRGEKLGFKVTVLLAISVLLLILNEILPSMSNKTPLIATYCIVIFALMLVSLLETILVTYLMDKDSQEKLNHECSWGDKNDEVNTKSCQEENKGQTFCSRICTVSDGEKQHELLPVVEEVNNGIHSPESNTLLSILEELKKLQTALFLHLNCRKKQGNSSCWARRINRAFFIFYLITVLLFLSFIFMEWNS
ncbi:5-hydroxytryptamine receptor 3A [Oryzias melastigma]|uniref:5-hydroxytryptamine receptor 3A n=1 Tax=Oryzias melastigma TaxID=30732 RepID=A0A834F2Z5_ORYME|nr:5-hydroxytryptamine receptor 3A [Oryzias melastigma]